MVIRGYEFLTDKVIDGYESRLSSVVQVGTLLNKVRGGAYILAIDGSSTSSGVVLFGLNKQTGKKQAKYGFLLRRSDKETQVEYRVRYKMFMSWLIQNNYITRVYYEQPIVYYINNVAPLFSLRTAVEEILIEYESQLRGRTSLFYVGNGTWKSMLWVWLGSDYAKYSDDQKEQAKGAFCSMIDVSQLDKLPAQDLFDAWALGSVGGVAAEEKNEEMMTQDDVVNSLNLQSGVLID